MPFLCKRISVPRPVSSQVSELSVDVRGVQPLPFDIAAVAKFYQEDPDVFIAVNTIASAVCGRGFEVVGGLPEEEANAAKGEVEQLSQEETFMEVLKQLVIDLNLLGNGYLEVARDRRDRPAAVYWVPATQMQRKRDMSGYVQSASGKTVEFNNYTPDPDRRAELRRAGRWRQGANEILHFRLPNPNSRYYGLPPTYTVAKDILSDAACKDSNMAFLQNGLCPDYAVLVKGGTVSEETVKMLKEYLRDAHTGPSKHHGFLLLEAVAGPGGERVEIELVPIQRHGDMQFVKYRQSNIEAKVRAFRVPMSKAGINQYGRLGEASSLGEDHTFKYQVIEPQQTMIEHAMTRMLQRDMGYESAEFRFLELDIKDESETARTAALLAGGAPILTVNEARAMMGLPPVEGGDKLPDGGLGGENGRRV